MDENKNPESVPFVVYETAQARADRRLKWMWWLLVIMFVALIGTNAGWIIYENQFEDTVTIEAEQTGSEVNIVGGGNVEYGTEGKNN